MGAAERDAAARLSSWRPKQITCAAKMRRCGRSWRCATCTGRHTVLFRRHQAGDSCAIIVYCNKIVADQHGIAREELIGKPITC